jgi:hypothetical protein
MRSVTASACLAMLACGDAGQAMPVMEMSAQTDAGGLALEAAVVDPCSTESGVLAEFPAQFSATQGKCSWLYGFRDAKSGAFQLLPAFDPAAQRWMHPAAQYLLIWAGGMHPYATAWPALRWESTFSGKVRVLGSVKLADSGQSIGGNGIVFRIRSSTVDVLTQPLPNAPLNAVPFDVTVDVEDGSAIDFMVDAKDGNNCYDTTALTVRIQRAD